MPLVMDRPGPITAVSWPELENLHPQLALSWTMRVEGVAAGGAPQPPSRARARASHVQAATRCAAAKSEGAEARCDQLS